MPHQRVIALILVLFGNTRFGYGELVARTWKKYFNSDTNFTVKGSVNIKQIVSGNDKTPGQEMSWNLQDVDPDCKTGSGNQCGIRIYEGTSCDEDALGHYWNKTRVTEDPWTAVQYDVHTYAGSEGLSKAVTATRIVTGTADIMGKVVIVHDATAPGRRIACALIVEAEPESERVRVGRTVVADAWEKYFDINKTNFTVTGSVSITQIEAGYDKIPGQELTWDLSGLDPACRTLFRNQSNQSNQSSQSSQPHQSNHPNSCGIAIHAGTSCDEDAKGHYWPKDKVTDNPWMSLRYDADDKGDSKVAVATRIVTGTANIVGKTIVVYDFSGRRVACALIVRPAVADMSGAASIAFGTHVFMMVLTAWLLLIGQRI